MIGVFLSDTRIPAPLFQLLENLGDGLAAFAPIDDPQSRLIGELSDFWALLETF